MHQVSEITPGQAECFRSCLFDWYDLHARDLPWRRSDDPYQVWVSEIMLQQTRVGQAQPYFERFLERFPDALALATAEQDEVLLQWEGLGYYSRARNLQKAARRLVDVFGGTFPRDPIEARTLPGVGAYTAAAVLSIAYGIPVAAVDGNVTRVLARYMAMETPVDKSAGRHRIQAGADHLVDPLDPGTFNQAMMDLGAIVCTPSSPTCDSCPVSLDCLAFKDGSVDQYPVTRKKAPVPHYNVAVGVIANESEEILLVQRPDDVLLGGLWEFPGGRCRQGERLRAAAQRGIADRLGFDVDPLDELVSVKHAFSHFKITMHAFVCRIESGAVASRHAQTHRWIARSDMNSVALHRAARRIADHVAGEGSGMLQGTSILGDVH